MSVENKNLIRSQNTNFVNGFRKLIGTQAPSSIRKHCAAHKFWKHMKTFQFWGKLWNLQKERFWVKAIQQASNKISSDQHNELLKFYLFLLLFLFLHKKTWHPMAHTEVSIYIFLLSYIMILLSFCYFWVIFYTHIMIILDPKIQIKFSEIWLL